MNTINQRSEYSLYNCNNNITFYWCWNPYYVHAGGQHKHWYMLFGENVVVWKTDRIVIYVYAYGKDIKKIEKKFIITGVTVYNFTTTNTTYFLIFNKSLYYVNKLDRSLVNINQIQPYVIGFWDNPYDPWHELTIKIND